MTELKDRIEEAFASTGLNASEFAKRVGVTEAAVSHWRGGRTKNLKAAVAQSIARVTGFRAEWLINGRGPKMETMDNIVPAKSQGRVPVISWIQAGELSDVLDIFHPGEAVSWADAWHTNPSASSYALVVEGDSMTSHTGSRSFPDGTTLIVDPEAAAKPGDFVIAKDVVNQRATFKQLMTDGARWYLKPLNPAYPTIEIDDPSLRVIGRVIEFQPPGGKL
jgi:SOS-response transcriptional repressor LexA